MVARKAKPSFTRDLSMHLLRSSLAHRRTASDVDTAPAGSRSPSFAGCFRTGAFLMSLGLQVNLCVNFAALLLLLLLLLLRLLLLRRCCRHERSCVLSR